MAVFINNEQGEMLMSFLKMGQEDIIRNNYVASCIILPTFRHSHDFFEISFGINGTATNIINDIPYSFGRGQCTIIRPIDNHYFKSESRKKSPIGYEHKDIYVKHEHFKEICHVINADLYDKIMNYEKPLVFDIDSEFYNYIYGQSLFLAELMSEKNDFFTAVHTAIITAILNQWLKAEIISKTFRPQWLNNLLPFFNSAEFLSKTVTEIARETGYTLPYFSSEFKKYVGMSAVSYLIKKRCAFSKQLLSENKMKIIDISLLLGFANPSTFSKHFHEEYGITPREYQKQN